MKVLTILKHSINALFFVFLFFSIFWLIVPFLDGVEHYSIKEIFLTLVILPLVHLVVLFMILFYLRKFILTAFTNSPLEKKSRVYLRRAGLFSIIYGLFLIPQFFGLLTFYIEAKELNFQLLSHLWELSSSFYSMIIGLFFIYLSKVLESSARINQENELTI